MKPSKVFRAILGRLRWAAQWRCKEPVVVFESDDWGMQRGGNLAAFEPYGATKDWTAEKTETPTVLRKLFEVLESQHDRRGRPAVFTANFITANPDFDAIKANNYTRYVDTPISNDQALLLIWREGIQRQVFYPQYHGRSHICVESWLEDLRKDAPGARSLFELRQNGGLALLSNANWRYHSEYVRWRNGKILPAEKLLDWINQGLDYFKEAFGFPSISSIAPHYILPKEVMQVWTKLGIAFVQGGNYHILRNHTSGEQIFLNHVLGEQSSEGLLYLARNVRFEPRLSQKDRGLEQAWRRIERCFQAGVPVVIDTHRINYTGPWQEASREALKRLLARIAGYHPLFLTSVELGLAIQGKGKYSDIWNHGACSLRTRKSIIQKLLQKMFTLINQKYLIE